MSFPSELFNCHTVPNKMNHNTKQQPYPWGGDVESDWLDFDSLSPPVSEPNASIVQAGRWTIIQGRNSIALVIELFLLIY